jgi:hypothetical protein
MVVSGKGEVGADLPLFSAKVRFLILARAKK